ncbi:Rrf2 family transcriptional regulator [Paenibacillus sp. JX-17]|uniref:Rrf2 family transcriptional regulator n=1 Tax=Paenibacillus lacisoli TaxID=3064525 RepID=A0ABT9CAZ0_9BACL|nr:Rrf2 family transcriptional regulator [Paenibacillus sp. JX-17]MDO7906424.1 Rrf2 family transcriptional regulator [Paenibacillus sp. JX-17]
MNMAKKTRAVTPRWLGIALQALIYLERNGELCASGEIAGRIHCEVTLVRRVLTRLVQAGLIAAREGRDGGYYLTRPGTEITLADIYQAVGMDASICPGILQTNTEESPFSTEVNHLVSDVLEESERVMMELWSSYTLSSLSERVYKQLK